MLSAVPSRFHLRLNRMHSSWSRSTYLLSWTSFINSIYNCRKWQFYLYPTRIIPVFTEMSLYSCNEYSFKTSRSYQSLLSFIMICVRPYGQLQFRASKSGFSRRQHIPTDYVLHYVSDYLPMTLKLRFCMQFLYNGLRMTYNWGRN